MVVASTIIASALLNPICNKLSSSLLSEFSLLWGLEKDLKALENTASTLKEVLKDADNCNTIDTNNWLRFKEIIYDTDDLLNELCLKAQIREDNKSCGQTSKGINRFFPKSNFVQRLKLAHRIKQINKNLLDAIASKRMLHLQFNVVACKNIGIINHETWSQFDEAEIYGRDREKEELISHLMKNDGSQNISIISIVGLGGIGKTTLVQLVYKNEYELKDCFNLRMWVYVSLSFDCEKIVRKMIEQITKTRCDSDSLESLGEKLQIELKGKKFLLVLDNVWDESNREWNKLKSVLKLGEFGSKIIMTTRSERVSEMMEATYKINLKGLSHNDSRNLFRRWAFAGSERGTDSRFLEIAEEITKKCGGVPLALTNLGSTMRSKDSIEAWKAVKDDAIWSLADDSNEVMECLKLSYMHLPSNLKQCFTYCSIFPKGKEINKLELIGQWMAHDLLGLADSIDAIEEKGNEYFRRLVQMSFLRNVVTDDGQEICTMHDLVHDLARSIVGPEFLEMKDEEVTEINGSSYRYISLINSSLKVKSTTAKKVRALHIQCSNYDSVADTVSKMKNLHSLVLEDLIAYKLPNFGKLIHLRFICIVQCNFTVIPDEISDLSSLRELYLKNCYNVTDLPESIGKLVHLSKLELNCDKLKSLPSKCRGLKYLFITSSHLDSIPNSQDQFGDILDFNLISCTKLRKLPNDILEKSNYVRSINLSYCHHLEEVPVSFGNLKSLETLDLSNCGRLQSLPESMGNLCNLRVLNLNSCTWLQKLPRCLGEMRKLMYLYMEGCPWISGTPIGVGNLCNLKRLSNFVVGIECNDHASMSELKYIISLSGSLEISGLQNLHNPMEAEHADLKYKQHLDSLNLKWGSDSSRKHISKIEKPVEYDWLGVLEALQPPSSIRSLTVEGYLGSKYPDWMMPNKTSTTTFPNLASLALYCLGCSDLPCLVHLSHLRILKLSDIKNLIVIDGYFPSIVELELSFMSNLERVITMDLFYHEEHRFPRLSKLEICKCPKLEMHPHLPPSVVELKLDQSNENILERTEISVGGTSQVSPLSLRVRELTICRMKLTKGCTLVGQLSSLKELKFHECELVNLPDIMRQVRCLLVLKINWCRYLHELPQWLGELKSLQELHLQETPLSILPLSIKELTQLQYLLIAGCPELERRCNRDNGEYRQLISHIPRVSLSELTPEALEFYDANPGTGTETGTVVGPSSFPTPGLDTKCVLTGGSRLIVPSRSSLGATPRVEHASPDQQMGQQA